MTKFLSLPCALCAEELEIQLEKIAALGTIEGENPLDDPYQSPKKMSFLNNGDRVTIEYSRESDVINITKIER